MRGALCRVGRVCASALALSCAQPPHNPAVRHDLLWGAWQTQAAVSRGFAQTELSIFFAGTEPDGRDGSVVWASLSAHSEQGDDAGCLVEVELSGSFLATCPEIAQPDPNNPAFPLGEARPGGCLSLHLDHGRLRRARCRDLARDHGWRELSVDGLNRGAFASLPYVRSSADRLALDWDGWVRLERTE